MRRQHPRVLSNIGQLFAVLTMGLMGVACRSTTAPAAVSADTWAVVDGSEITRNEVEKAFRRADGAQTMSEEEALTAKLNLLEDLIMQEILIAKAGALKVEVPESELDTAYNDAKRNIPDEAFQQELTRR